MNEYRVGLTCAVLEYTVKKYKSHCRLSYSINLFTVEDEYLKKKVANDLQAMQVNYKLFLIYVRHFNNKFFFSQLNVANALEFLSFLK